MLAPIAWRVPPRHYGPWERVVSLLTEGLVKSGVDVTLFATADSHTGAHLSAVVPSPYEETPGMDAKVWEGLHIAHAFSRAREFDLIHNHYDFLPLTYASLVDRPAPLKSGPPLARLCPFSRACFRRRPKRSTLPR